MSTFVLVHGGCHGAWCWFRLAPLLEAAGHRVITPDMPGHGADRTPLKGLTQDDYVAVIESILCSLDEPAVLVGHSISGVTVTLAAERCPERLKALIYLSATIVSGGYSIMTDPAQAELIAGFGSTMVIDEVNDAIIPRPEAAPRLFYGGCDPGDVALALRLLTPEPMGAFSTPINVTDSAYGRVRRAAIVTLDDVICPPQRQFDMCDRHGITDIVTLPAAHSSFLSAPELLARKLQQLAG